MGVCLSADNRKNNANILILGMKGVGKKAVHEGLMALYGGGKRLGENVLPHIYTERNMRTADDSVHPAGKHNLMKESVETGDISGHIDLNGMSMHIARTRMEPLSDSAVHLSLPEWPDPPHRTNT